MGHDFAQALAIAILLGILAWSTGEAVARSGAIQTDWWQHE